MNFIVNLPIDQNCTTVLTVVDHFLKMCMFIPLVEEQAIIILSYTTTEHIAQAFYQHVVAYHRLPRHNINDQDVIFPG